MTGTAGNGSRADVRVGGSLLPRNRLIEALNGAKSVRVVVLEAPAGYSKTTTLRLWDDADTRPFAWVRCEPRYNDPALLANTLVGAEEAPEELGGTLELGRMTSGIGVMEDGKWINRENGSIGIPEGRHHLTLYVANTGALHAGVYLRLIGRVPGGGLVKGPVISY